MHISECIHVDDIDVIARNTVMDIGDAIQCSEDIRTALLNRGADARTAFAVSLFIEEICTNTIEHGFGRSDTKRKLFLPREEYTSVFCFLADGGVTLRIYDNCVLFDPAEKLRSLEETEKSPERGIGLKLVFSMADEASYTSMLNMNHMLIRVPLHRSEAFSTENKKTLHCHDERFLL